MQCPTKLIARMFLSLLAASWQRPRFQRRAQEYFRVYFDSKIHQRIAAHAAEKLALEICGVLVGDWHKDETARTS